MPHDQLVTLALSMRERMEHYQGLLYRANKDRFGTSLEKSQKTNKDTPPGTDPAGDSKDPKQKMQ